MKMGSRRCSHAVDDRVHRVLGPACWPEMLSFCLMWRSFTRLCRRGGVLPPTLVMALDASWSTRRALDESTSGLSSSLFFHASGAGTSPARGGLPPSSPPARLSHLASSFALQDAEWSFFDGVIALVPPGSSSFAELKAAFEACQHEPALLQPVVTALGSPTATPQEARHAVEARLWNTLLSLVQVRGHTWSERWDAIRVGSGKEPREESEAPLGRPPTLASVPAIVPAAAPAPEWQESDTSLDEGVLEPRMLPIASLPPPILARRLALWHRESLREAFHHWRERRWAFVRMDSRAKNTHVKLQLLQVWLRWRALLVRHRHRRHAADIWATHASQHRAWHRWRHAFASHMHEKRLQRYHAMHAACASVEAQRTHRLVSIAWMLWRRAFMYREAKRLDAQRLVPVAWRHWRERWAYLRTLPQKGALLVSYTQQHLCQAAFFAWRMRLGERRRHMYACDEAEAWHQTQLRRKAWRRWRAQGHRHEVRTHPTTHLDPLSSSGAMDTHCTSSSHAERMGFMVLGLAS